MMTTTQFPHISNVRRPGMDPAHIRQIASSAVAPALAARDLAHHLFTDAVAETCLIDTVAANDLNTVLSNQITATLDQPNVCGSAVFEAIRELVIDANRIATRDGRSAVMVCGDQWPTVERAVRRHADDAAEAARRFGAEAMIALAASRAHNELTPLAAIA